MPYENPSYDLGTGGRIRDSHASVEKQLVSHWAFPFFVWIQAACLENDTINKINVTWAKEKSCFYS